MATQVTLIGLGQIGASMGLALAEYKEKILRIGHDKKTDVEREALKRGAVDKVEHNLPSAVRDARLVVMSLPISQVRETLELIGPDLTEGTVVIDTSPIKSEIIKWAAEFLPKGCYYVGLAPAINPEMMHELQFGIEAAQADLFKKGVFLVSAPPNTPEEAVTLATDLVRLLGAQALIADPAESDGLMASIHLLPQLVAAAMLNATVDQPGWQEARKVAGRSFAAVTAGLAYQDEIDSLRMSALHGRVGMVHALDVMIASLKGLRDDIENNDDEGVAARFETALDGRKRWLRERLTADWQNQKSEPMEIPSMGERMFGSLFTRKPRQK